ncbi:MAG: hypothetical protein WA996_24220 [Candidatus Promineifilaceae bacterium]
MRTLNPLYLVKLGWSLAISIVPIGNGLPPNWVPVNGEVRTPDSD